MRGPSDVFARILPFSFPLLLPLPLSPGRSKGKRALPVRDSDLRGVHAERLVMGSRESVFISLLEDLLLDRGPEQLQPEIRTLSLLHVWS